jgi:hypothetical protein
MKKFSTIIDELEVKCQKGQAGAKMNIIRKLRFSIGELKKSWLYRIVRFII